jgi:hypothetical protein
MRAIVVLFAIAACGDNIEPDLNIARSGWRLKLMFYDYGDDTRELERQWFHDGLRGERCTPRMWSDGVTICTPESTDTVFPTSDCVHPLGRVPTGRPVPPYFVRDYYLAGAWVPSRIFVAGERAEVPALGWEKRDGACLGPYETAGFDYYEIGRELPRSELARITHPDARTTARLALTSVASEDGLYAPTGVTDRELEVRCLPDASPGSDETRCVPDGVATAEYFNDPACTVPELAITRGDALPALLRHHDARSACTSYHAVGVEVDAPPLYHRNGPSCVDIAAPATNRYFVAGAPRELGTFARVRDATPRRLHPIELAHGDLRIADELLFDETLATECRRGEIDGAMYCLPATSIAIVERFADDACVATVPLAEVHTGACAPPATFALAPSRAIHAIGTVHTAPLYHLSTGDRCLPYAIPEGIVLHDVGPPLPVATFAAATVVVDP